MYVRECERDRRVSEKKTLRRRILRRCCAPAKTHGITPRSPPHPDLHLMVTATPTGTTLFNLSPISSFTGPPAVLEATSTTPLYLHAPTHAVAGHGTFKESENETKLCLENLELTGYRPLEKNRGAASPARPAAPRSSSRERPAPPASTSHRAPPP
jgi:hypothetical protein